MRRHFVLQLLFLAFALLVCDTAAGLACGLAGSLAFAAAAVLCGLAKVLGSESLDVLHGCVLQNSFFTVYHIFEEMSMCILHKNQYSA